MIDWTSGHIDFSSLKLEKRKKPLLTDPHLLRYASNTTKKLHFLPKQENTNPLSFFIQEQEKIAKDAENGKFPPLLSDTNKWGEKIDTLETIISDLRQGKKTVHINWREIPSAYTEYFPLTYRVLLYLDLPYLQRFTDNDFHILGFILFNIRSHGLSHSMPYEKTILGDHLLWLNTGVANAAAVSQGYMAKLFNIHRDTIVESIHNLKLMKIISSRGMPQTIEGEGKSKSIKWQPNCYFLQIPIICALLRAYYTQFPKAFYIRASSPEQLQAYKDESIKKCQKEIEIRNSYSLRSIERTAEYISRPNSDKPEKTTIVVQHDTIGGFIKSNHPYYLARKIAAMEREIYNPQYTSPVLPKDPTEVERAIFCKALYQEKQKLQLIYAKKNNQLNQYFVKHTEYTKKQNKRYIELQNRKDSAKRDKLLSLSQNIEKARDAYNSPIKVPSPVLSSQNIETDTELQENVNRARNMYIKSKKEESMKTIEQEESALYEEIKNEKPRQDALKLRGKRKYLKIRKYTEDEYQRYPVGQRYFQGHKNAYNGLYNTLFNLEYWITRKKKYPYSFAEYVDLNTKKIIRNSFCTSLILCGLDINQKSVQKKLKLAESLVYACFEDYMPPILREKAGDKEINVYNYRIKNFKNNLFPVMSFIFKNIFGTKNSEALQPLYVQYLNADEKNYPKNGMDLTTCLTPIQKLYNISYEDILDNSNNIPNYNKKREVENFSAKFSFSFSLTKEKAEEFWFNLFRENKIKNGMEYTTMKRFSIFEMKNKSLTYSQVGPYQKIRKLYRKNVCDTYILIPNNLSTLLQDYLYPQSSLQYSKNLEKQLSLKIQTLYKM